MRLPAHVFPDDRPVLSERVLAFRFQPCPAFWFREAAGGGGSLVPGVEVKILFLALLCMLWLQGLRGYFSCAF